jgi:RNA polymerase sigma factor (sigma-70 family)
LPPQEVAQIYGSSGALMLKRCRVILRNDGLAGDAFEDAFINLIRYGKNYREAQSKLRWLYTICDRSCFRLLKKQSPERRDELPEPLPDLRNSPPTTRTEARESVLGVLHELPEDDQSIAVLAFLDGMSPAEIGEQVRVSRQTVNEKLAGIRERARIVLGEDDE